MASSLGRNALVVGPADVLTTVSAVLGGAGYSIGPEADAAGALGTLGQGPLDLVIVTWDGPGGDAERLCRAIRASPRYQDLYILLLVPGDSAEPEQADDSGADDYLFAPFEADALLARIRTGEEQTTLRNSEERLQAVIANVPGAIYRCANDADWTMKLISDEIERISGYPVDDFINSRVRTYASVIHPEDRAEVDRGVQYGVDHEKIFALEYRIVRADDTVAWVLERGQQVRDANGRVWLDGVIFDITERREAEQGLRDSLRRLAVAEDRQRIARDLHDGVAGSLVGLSAILRALGMVADDPEKVRESLATSVDQINSVIDDIRGYTRQ